MLADRTWKYKMARTKLCNYCIWPYKHLYVIYRWISRATNWHQPLNMSQQNNEGELLNCSLILCLQDSGLFSYVYWSVAVDGVESHQMCVSGTGTDLPAVHSSGNPQPSTGLLYLLDARAQHSSSVPNRSCGTGSQAPEQKKRLIYKIKTVKLCLYGLSCFHVLHQQKQ